MSGYIRRGANLFDAATGARVGYIDNNGNEALVEGGGNTTTVATSRALTAADNGATLECTATVSLTVPAGLPANFGCAVMPFGTTSVVSGGGTLLNGATTTLTRTAASNGMFAITARASVANSYVVTGV